jgi:tRNA(Ile)-lysidine synthase
MTEKSGQILRPLLNLKKSQILEYLKLNNLKYYVDITNNDRDITRNYLRHELIPKFSKINSNYKSNFNNLINYLEEIKDNIDNQVLEFI